MKPCDCKDLLDVSRMNESGISFNDHRIEVCPPSVFIDLGISCRVRISQRKFKRLAEWYLSENYREDDLK